jgi:hypothetical protein
MRKCWIIKTPGQTEVFSSLTYACEVHPVLNKHTSTIYKTEMDVERSYGHGANWLTIEHVKLYIK